MYLSRPIYELLPYIYLAVALLLIASAPPIMMGHISADLLLFCGAYIWMMRSDARRTDVDEDRKGSSFKLAYELKPFICLGIAAELIGFERNLFTLTTASALCLYALSLLVVRIRYRRHRVLF